MEEIIKTYENHPSFKLIKDNVLSEDEDFTIEPFIVLEINKIIKHLNPRKATGPDKISVKIAKLTANIIDSHLSSIIYNFSRNSFSISAKVTSVGLILKKKRR